MMALPGNKKSPAPELIEVACSYREAKSPAVGSPEVVGVCAADADQFRVIPVNNPDKNKAQNYCSNVVITSKYTSWNFVPKILFYEFSKLANAYFLVVSVMQTIPAITNTGGYPASLPTLLVIIIVDAVFAALEDFKRHKADDIANNMTTHRYDPKNNKMEDIKWSEVKVGDILKILNREDIPADMVILATDEDPNKPPTGVCYVETKSLDGETNLKLRQGVESTYTVVKGVDQLASLRGELVCEKPNRVIHKYTGLYLDEKGNREVLSHNHVLLRGCSLRNTGHIYGLVFNTGDETKIMMSVEKPPTKWSTLERKLNVTIKAIVVIMVTLCAIGAALALIWNKRKLGTRSSSKTWYLPSSRHRSLTSPAAQYFVDLFYYFLLMNQFIPISLYVSMTSIKFIQAYFIAQDIKMYHEETDTPAMVRTMSLNEELGQIDHIFSDKTGTLTCNVMEFRKISINGVSYGKGTTEVGQAAALRKRGSRMHFGVEEKSATAIVKPYVNFEGPEFFADLAGGAGPEQQEKIREMLEHLAVCHTVIPEHGEDGEIRLSASSPDEQALVAGADALGIKFVDRGLGTAMVKQLDGTTQEYKILDILEFNSTRKRMSVIIRDPKGRIRLLCKGADTVIQERLKQTKTPQEDVIVQTTLQHMCTYAAEGLRTLLIATLDLEEGFYAKWSHDFHAANRNLNEVEKRKAGEPNMIDELMESVERDLTILGATAIEDKLQSGVPSTIADMRGAGIKVWMLTGDKEETAINIGYACQLFTNEVLSLVINTERYPDPMLIKTELTRHAKAASEKKFIQPLVFDEESDDDGEQVIPQTPDVIEVAGNYTGWGLVIDGEALHIVMDTCANEFIAFATYCTSVIACRVSPAQKAEIVELVKTTDPAARTLAIGDGANDVSMIQSAHVGVGISGQEGMQAVNSSDYAIAQFRYLRRLLLVHGRWNYIRMSKLVCYTFYKNITMCLTQLWYYLFFTGYSGQKFYLELGIQMFNLLYTALPPILVGVFDQDVPDNLAERFPRLYSTGLLDQKYNRAVVLSWGWSCIYESVVICFGVLFSYNTTEYGTANMWEIGGVVFSMVVIVVNLKMALNQNIFHWINGVIYALSVFLWFATAELASATKVFSPGSWYRLWPQVRANGVFWLLLLLIPFAALWRDVYWKAWKRNMKPEYYHLAQEVHANGWDDFADKLLSYPPPTHLPPEVRLHRRGLLPRVESRSTRATEPLKSPSPRTTEITGSPLLSDVNLAKNQQSIRGRGSVFSYDHESSLAQAYIIEHSGRHGERASPRRERGSSLYGSLFDHIAGPSEEELHRQRSSRTLERISRHRSNTLENLIQLPSYYSESSLIGSGHSPALYSSSQRSIGGRSQTDLSSVTRSQSEVTVLASARNSENARETHSFNVSRKKL